jgi:hypothetical protein
MDVSSVPVARWLRLLMSNLARVAMFTLFAHPATIATVVRRSKVSDFEISVCVKQKCRCGQEWEQTIHIKQDEAAYLTLSSLPPSISMDFSTFEIPKIPDVQLSLIGHVERLNVEGMDASGNSIRCSKCGEDLLYIGRGDIEGIEKVYPKEE